MRFDRPRPLTMAQQYLNLRANPLCAGSGRLRGNILAWTFPITPTPLSRCYKARIEYRQGTSPQVFIDQPDLTALATGRRLPHVYEQSPTRLCLFLPGSGEWDAWMRLDRTIVPWAALWLLYFEGWLFSGEWAGGGLHPVIRERATDRARRNPATRVRPVGARHERE
jgi:hypothetical protein